MLAKRTELFGVSGTASARAAAAAAGASGKEIVDLTSGEIWADIAPTIRRGAIAAIERGDNRYTDTIGLPKLRSALANLVTTQTGSAWSGAEIAVTAGAKQALFHAAMLLLNPGDEVLIPAPYWTTFPAQVLLAGGKPVFVDSADSDYVVDVHALQAAITPATRAIILNTPGNPTGAVYPERALAAIAELASRHELWVIFDECYGRFTYDSNAHAHIVRVAPELRGRTLIVNAFSKQLALTGWRIGYLAGPEPVIKAARAMQSHTTSNPNVIAQHAVLEHLEHGDGAYEAALSARLASSRRLGLELLATLERVPVPKAQGGFYFYLDLRRLLRETAAANSSSNADDLVAALLAAGVATVSGTAFGDPYGLRISYGAPAEQLEVGLRRVVEVLNAWPSRLS